MSQTTLYHVEFLEVFARLERMETMLHLLVENQNIEYTPPTDEEELAKTMQDYVTRIRKNIAR